MAGGCYYSFVTATTIVQAMDRGFAMTMTSCTLTIASLSPAVSNITPTVSVQSILLTTRCEVVGTDESEAHGLSMFISGNRISFTLRMDSRVRLSVYDPAGRLVLMPLNGQAQAGEHEISLDAWLSLSWRARGQ
ncbi:MAG: hypothetical protein ACP5QG_05970 [candidate division WOR-3 bacterium]